MSKEKHTEWISDPDQREGMEWNIHIVERDRPHMRICFMSNGPESEANAARIIQTNQIPALVKALEEIGYIDDFLDADSAKRMLGIARDALAAYRKD